MTDKPKRGRGRGRRLYKQDPSIGARSNADGLTRGMKSCIPEEILALAQVTELPVADAPQPVKTEPHFKPTDPGVIDPSTLPHVRITDVMDPSCFYARVSHKEDMDKFEEMSNLLSELCESNKNEQKVLPRLDDFVGVSTANFENFGLEYKWVRGRVVRTHSADEIEVILVDFGSSHLVSLSSICLSIYDSIKLPSLLMHCGLADCQPIGREWSRDSCDYFHSLISKYDPHLRGVIHVGTTVKSFITSLTLYGYSEKKGWISFGHALIEAGHAVTYHNTNTVQYPSTTEATSYDPFQYLNNNNNYLPTNSGNINELQTTSEMYNLTYTEQQMLHDIENDVYVSPFIPNEHMIRSLDSVTKYEEFVPKVHPIGSSIDNTETVQTADSKQEAARIMTQVEKVEKNTSDLTVTNKPPSETSDTQTKTRSQHSTPSHKSLTPTSGVNSPRAMGRGHMIKQNMERARMAILDRSSPLANSSNELSMQVAKIVVTPKTSPGDNDSSSSSLDKEVIEAFANVKSNEPDTTLENETGKDDEDSKKEYAEEFEQSFGHAKGESPVRQYKGRGLKSPVHWKKGVRSERRFKQPLPTGKETKMAPIPLASIYAKSITAEAKVKTEPTIQDSEISNLKCKLASQLDILLANFREETQRQFPDNVMKILNDTLANKIGTILGPKGPFVILLNCIFQRSIDLPQFLPLSFMVLGRVYSMYKQLMSENLSHCLIRTQCGLVRELKFESSNTEQYKTNYCQMISACIDFAASKEINSGLLAILESAILDFLLLFSGKELELPLIDLPTYQIQAGCLLSVLEKSGRVLLNFKNDCFNKIRQQISYNVSEMQSMPFSLLNTYTCCLELFEKISSAGKQAPLGLTNLSSQMVMNLPQPYTNQNYQQPMPNYQTQPYSHPQYPSTYPQYSQGNIPVQASYGQTQYDPNYYPHMQPPNQVIYPPPPPQQIPMSSQQHQIPNQQQQLPNSQQQQQQQQQLPNPQQQQQQLPNPQQQQQQLPNPQQQRQQLTNPQQLQQQIPNQKQPMVNQQLPIPAPYQQQQILSPPPPVASQIPQSPVEPTPSGNQEFEQIKIMLTSFNELSQLKKFQDACIKDDLLSIEWYELDKLLKDSSIPPGLIFRIKRYLSVQNSAPTPQQQQQQQQRTQPTYPPQFPSSQSLYHQPVNQLPTQQMCSEYIPQNTQQTYYQQPLSPQQPPPLQQQPQQAPQQQQQQPQPQQQQQVINPNPNSNSNNNIFSFPKTTLPTQHTHSQIQSNNHGDGTFRPPFDVQTSQYTSRPYYSK